MQKIIVLVLGMTAFNSYADCPPAAQKGIDDVKKQALVNIATNNSINSAQIDLYKKFESDSVQKNQVVKIHLALINALSIISVQTESDLADILNAPGNEDCK